MLDQMVYIYMCMCTYLCVYTYIHTYIHTHIYIYIYIIFHWKAAEYAFFSNAHGTCAHGCTWNILGYKAGLSKFKKTEIISTIISDHNAMRLEINYRKKDCEKHKHMEVNQYATKQPMDHWRNKKYLETNEHESTIIQNLWGLGMPAPPPVGGWAGSAELPVCGTWGTWWMRWQRAVVFQRCAWLGPLPPPCSSHPRPPAVWPPWRLVRRTAPMAVPQRPWARGGDWACWPPPGSPSTASPWLQGGWYWLLHVL